MNNSIYTNDFESLFDVEYSLPVGGHSVAIASRTPTADYGQETKFMPDFGGIVETSDGILKNNALAQGIPIKPISRFIVLGCRKFDEDEKEPSKIVCDCLAVTSHLEDNHVTIIQAINKRLYLDSFPETSDCYSYEKSNQYANILFNDPILGIKYLVSTPEILLVKFANCVKTLNVALPQDEGYTDISKRNDSILGSVNGVVSSKNFYVKDASLNQFNRSLLSVAYDSNNRHLVNIYDLAMKSAIQTISWDKPKIGDLNSDSCPSQGLSGLSFGRHTTRKFIPKEPSSRGIQQIDNIPSHLVNLVVTSDYQTALVDPRSNLIQQVYVDKIDTPNFYPIEYMRRTSFSQSNSYQFYSLTNVHLRVYDTRYPGLPMHQNNHMLDSNFYDSMSMEVINHNGNDVETLCLSSSDRICFISFDHSKTSLLVNPKSLHLPYHEPSPRRLNELYGLGIHLNQQQNAHGKSFDLIRLTDRGHLCFQKYACSVGNQLSEFVHATQSEEIINRERASGGNPEKVVPRTELSLRDSLDKNNIPSDEMIDIVNMELVFPKMSASERASERYNKMMSKLDWC